MYSFHSFVPNTAHPRYPPACTSRGPNKKSAAEAGPQFEHFLILKHSGVLLQRATPGSVKSWCTLGRNSLWIILRPQILRHSSWLKHPVLRARNSHSLLVFLGLVTFSLGSPAQHLWWPNLSVASTVCTRQGQNVPLSYHPVSHNTHTHEVASPGRTKYSTISEKLMFVSISCPNYGSKSSFAQQLVPQLGVDRGVKSDEAWLQITTHTVGKHCSADWPQTGMASQVRLRNFPSCSVCTLVSQTIKVDWFNGSHILAISKVEKSARSILSPHINRIGQR